MLTADSLAACNHDRADRQAGEPEPPAQSAPAEPVQTPEPAPEPQPKPVTPEPEPAPTPEPVPEPQPAPEPQPEPAPEPEPVVTVTPPQEEAPQQQQKQDVPSGSETDKTNSSDEIKEPKRTEADPATLSEVEKEFIERGGKIIIEEDGTKTLLDRLMEDIIA